MTKLTAAQKRFLENATLIAALRLAFQKLKEAGVPTYLLNEIAETTSGGTPSRRSESFYGGQIPWIKSGELNDGLITQAEEFITQEGLEKSSAKVFPKGTVVIALYGATVGKMGILGLDAASNQAVCAVTPRSRKINNSFLFWFLRNKRQDFLDDSFGGAQPNISQKVLRETLIPVPSMEMQNKLCTFFEAVEKRQQGERSISLPELPPPLEEQRRIVARIEELAEKIEEARGLRMRAIEDWDVLCRSIIFSTTVDKKLTPMHELVSLRELNVTVSPLESYSFAGVYSFGRGVFKQHSLQGTEFSYNKLTRLSAGNFVYPKLMAWEGALGTVPDECDGLVVSPEFPVFDVNEDKVLPETLDVYFRTPSVWSLLSGISTGTNIRRRRLHPSNFLQFEIPLPDMKTQQKLRDVKAKSDQMKSHRQKALQEFDALLPAILDKAFKGEL